MLTYLIRKLKCAMGRHETQVVCGYSGPFYERCMHCDWSNHWSNQS